MLRCHPPSRSGSAATSERTRVGPKTAVLGCVVGFCCIACTSQTLEPITFSGPWCTRNSTPRTLYCRDFDDGGAFDAGWSSTYFNRTELGGVDPTDSAPDSPPNSVLFSTPTLAANATAVDQLKENASSASGIVVDLALKVTQFDANAADLTLVTIYLQSSDAWFLGLDLVGTSLQLTEEQPGPDGGTGTQIHHQAPLPSLGGWDRVRLTLRVASGSTTGSLEYNGRVLVGPIPLTPPSPPTDCLVNLGIAYLGGPAAPMRIHIDNFKIDSAPP